MKAKQNIKRTQTKMKKTKLSAKEVFEDAKIRMMMQIYRLPREEAVQRIAARLNACEEAAKDKQQNAKRPVDIQRTPPDEDLLMSAEDFFGSVD